MIVLMSFRGDTLYFNFMLFKLFIDVSILSLTHLEYSLMSYQSVPYILCIYSQDSTM